MQQSKDIKEPLLKGDNQTSNVELHKLSGTCNFYTRQNNIYDCITIDDFGRNTEEDNIKAEIA